MVKSKKLLMVGRTSSKMDEDLKLRVRNKSPFYTDVPVSRDYGLTQTSKRLDRPRSGQSLDNSVKSSLLSVRSEVEEKKQSRFSDQKDLSK